MKTWMKPKESRAFIFYIITTICFWGFGRTLGDIFTKPVFVAATRHNPLFSLVYTENTGGAFSILSGHTFLLALFGIVSISVVCFYVYRFAQFEDKFQILSATLFSAGILGNVIERLQHGFVVDYIKLNFINFAVFNVYDVMICSSVLLFIFFVLFEELFKKVKP